MKLLAFVILALLAALPSGVGAQAIPTTNLKLELIAGTGQTLSGSEITTWADQSGNGFDVTGATANTSKPIAATDAAGNAVVRFQWGFSAAHPKSYFTIPAGLSISTQAVSVYVVATDTNYGNQTLVTLGDETFPTGWLNVDTTSNTPPKLGVSTRLPGTPIYVPMNKSIYTAIGGATQGVVGRNSTFQTTTSSALATLTGGKIGRYAAGNANFSGDIYCVLIYNVEHNSTQRAAVIAALQAMYPDIVTSFTKQVVFVGDSLTAGVQSTSLQSYPYQVYFSRTDWLQWNLGVGSKKIGVLATANTFANTQSTMVDPLFNGSLTTNLLLQMCGTNDIGGDAQTAAQTFTRLTTWLSACHTAGWTNWAVTIPDRNDGFRTIVQGYNALIRGGDATIDKVIDCGSGSTFEARLSNADNATYFFTDKLHELNAGYGVESTFIVPFLAATGVTFSGPATGISGHASTNFTVTIANGAAFSGNETVTISDGGNGGTITPSVGSPGTSSVTVTPTQGATSFTTTYTPASSGTKTLTLTNGTGWVNPTALSYSSVAGGHSRHPGDPAGSRHPHRLPVRRYLPTYREAA